MKLKKRKKCCEECTSCVYLEQGDHICTYGEPVLIIEDFFPTDEYYYCNGEYYESWEDFGKEDE